MLIILILNKSPGGNMQIFICPKATPRAMPQAIF
ncbi:hypothetical protein T01_14829 [Trichinella spiralis]|uniref:Uncharacterized protein n=1 Tax=Trichinella spiralis TaxID=6334 RepID=A0A0V0YU29_TRISP|nr:hypothetical protein T01_14829 [Trichinella spiralis]